MPIRRCTCKADKRGNEAAAKFQDQTYGPGMRVWTTAGTKAAKSTKSRCTVCGDNVSVVLEAPKEVKDAKNSGAEKKEEGKKDVAKTDKAGKK